MRILITGAGGFVGRNLCEYFSSKRTYAVTAATSGELNLLDEDTVYRWLKQTKYDIIIHASIYNPRVVSGGREEKELEYDLRMFYNLSKYHELYGKMIYFGSGAEYDKRFPICSVAEDQFENGVPDSSYGLAKYIIGKQIEKSENIYNLRIFGLFGKYENWKKAFISGACCKVLKNLPITIRRNVYFDYLYINDFCDMVERFLLLRKPRYHSYNTVSGKRIDLISLAEIVKQVSGKDVPVVVCEAGLANEYTADNARLLAEIGKVQLTSYEEAVRELYSWYSEHERQIDLLSLLY